LRSPLQQSRLQVWRGRPKPKCALARDLGSGKAPKSPDEIPTRFQSAELWDFLVGRSLSARFAPGAYDFILGAFGNVGDAFAARRCPGVADGMNKACVEANGTTDSMRTSGIADWHRQRPPLDSFQCAFRASSSLFLWLPPPYSRAVCRCLPSCVTTQTHIILTDMPQS
jgi:hypothetical protein